MGKFSVFNYSNSLHCIGRYHLRRFSENSIPKLLRKAKTKKVSEPNESRERKKIEIKVTILEQIAERLIYQGYLFYYFLNCLFLSILVYCWVQMSDELTKYEIDQINRIDAKFSEIKQKNNQATSRFEGKFKEVALAIAQLYSTIGFG